MKFHPDGHLLAAGGTDGQIKLFDVKTGALMAAFDQPGPVKALDFSENGTWLATAAEGSSTVSIWDLRKTSIIHTIDVGSKPVESIQWDYTGQFLLTGGSEGVAVQYYSKPAKSWSEVLKAAVPAVAVAWGAEAQRIFSLNGEGVVTLLAGQ